MPIPFQCNCSPTEFLEQLVADIAAGRVSSFAVVVSYEEGPVESLVGARHNERQRLLQLAPELSRIAGVALADVLGTPMQTSVSGPRDDEAPP